MLVQDLGEIHRNIYLCVLRPELFWFGVCLELCSNLLKVQVVVSDSELGSNTVFTSPEASNKYEVFKSLNFMYCFKNAFLLTREICAQMRAFVYTIDADTHFQLKKIPWIIVFI